MNQAGAVAREVERLAVAREMERLQQRGRALSVEGECEKRSVQAVGLDDRRRDRDGRAINQEREVGHRRPVAARRLRADDQVMDAVGQVADGDRRPGVG